MIIDLLSNVSSLSVLGPNFTKAAAFVAAHDLSALPDGRTEVDGDKVFINKSTNRYSREEMCYEAHKKYADIQVILSGEERFGWGALVETEPYAEANDFLPCSASDPVDFTLCPGQFVLFMPGEPHAPGNYVVRDAPVSKAVIKVLV